jgi:hypothetical protein
MFPLVFYIILYISKSSRRTTGWHTSAEPKCVLSPSASFSPGWHFTGSYSLPTCWLLEDGSMTPLAPFASLCRRAPLIFARTVLSLRQFGRVCNLGTSRTPDLNLTAFLPSPTGGTRLSKGRTRRSSGG